MFTNLLNNAKYIGQSKNIKKRILYHHQCDYSNPNNSQYNTKFYRAIRNNGDNNFVATILELCPVDQLNEREIFYINKFNSYHRGYNSTLGGQIVSQSILHSEEVENKRRQTRVHNKSLQSENHPRAKLSNEEVWNIRQRYKDGESVKDIYQDYDRLYPSLNVFKRIILGYTYKTVGNIPDKEEIRHTNGKFTPEQIRCIRQQHTDGASYTGIARKYGVSMSSIRNIVNYKTYVQVV